MTRTRPSRPQTRGFTLIELLISVAIVAVLASGALTLYQVAAQRARESELREDLRALRSAIDAYKLAYDTGHIAKTLDASGYPPTLGVLAQGVEDVQSPVKKKIYFLRRIPHDPMADPALPADESWGLRSYESDPDNPEPGDDVYDVYSQSARVGLNGIPYNKW